MLTLKDELLSYNQQLTKTNKTMPRGGKRKGSGRKLGGGQYGEPTTPIRIPLSLVEKVKEFINQWKKGNENPDKKISD